MKSPNVWTKQRPDNTWQAKREGASRASGVFRTQAEAWDKSREIAKREGGEAFLCNRGGQIRERNTYTGHDPRDIQG
ncbi:DUF2188 domain-containing protein [Tichowtungia aerotolerans]|uniref:DUF2188 domain-containing protein n=1 Tax=Tichowtungia aerotolerans TaxID=2697043 RepID=A0A6P1MD44_9BACT|nr:DUF2188 domain-containing protein [Tichowtungia aerotolerans]QHI70494.1 DUF2188 domain-containing protein [Tichowtungia aerotolerans]